MLSKALFAIAAIAVVVNAQSTSSAPAPTGSDIPDSPCIDACVNASLAQNGCSSVQDLLCICTNPQFQADAAGCLQQNCPPGDLQNALQLQLQVCTAGGFTSSFTATPTPRPVSFTSVPARSSGSGSSGSSVRPSSGSSVSSPSPAVSRSATTPVASGSTPSTAAGISPQAGAGAIFGAIIAAIFTL